MFVFSLFISLASAHSQEDRNLIWVDGEILQLENSSISCGNTYYKEGKFPLKGYFFKAEPGYSKHEVQIYKSGVLGVVKELFGSSDVKALSLMNGALLKPLDKNSGLAAVVSNISMEESDLTPALNGTKLSVKKDNIRSIEQQKLRIFKNYDLSLLDVNSSLGVNINLQDLLWSLEVSEDRSVQAAQCGVTEDSLEDYLKLVSSIDGQKIRFLVPFIEEKLNEKENTALSYAKVLWTEEYEENIEVEEERLQIEEVGGSTAPIVMGGVSILKNTPLSKDEQASPKIKNSGVELNSIPKMLQKLRVSKEKEQIPIINIEAKPMVMKVKFLNEAKEKDPSKSPMVTEKKEEPLVKKAKPLKNLSEREKIFIKSQDKYLCVNNYLTGYPDKIGVEAVHLQRSQDVVQYVEDVEAVEQTRKGNISKFVRISYKKKEYWAKESVFYKKTKTLDTFIATYSNCPKIQNEILKKYSPVLDAGKYFVCTEVGDPLQASLTEERKNEHKLESGSEVTFDSEDRFKYFDGGNGHTYIRIEQNEKKYWVAQAFIKKYKTCESYDWFKSGKRGIEYDINSTYTNPEKYFLGRKSKRSAFRKRLRQLKVVDDSGATVKRSLCGSYHYNSETFGGIKNGDTFIEPEVLSCFMATLQEFRKKYPESRVQWGDISRGDRVRFRPHKTHKKGRDIDVRVIRNDRKLLGCKYGSSCYDQVKTKYLIEAALRFGGKPVYFQDPKIFKSHKDIKSVKKHKDHFHIHYSRGCKDVKLEERYCPRGEI